MRFGTANQQQIRDIHRDALSPDLSTRQSADLLKRVRAGYDNNSDRGRANRDAAIYEFRDGNPVWKKLIHSSFHFLDEALRDENGHDVTEILREEAATFGVYGRLELSEALQSGVSAHFRMPLKRLKTARKKLKAASGRSLRPDQYEINMAAARVIAERYYYNSGRGVSALGRAAFIAWMSESRLARNNGNLPKPERKAARKRSIARTAFAARLVFSRDEYVWRQDIRRQAAELVA